MDGDQEAPRRSAAENQGRRDGIRAGSVSGPWRSAPRAEAEPEPAAEAAAEVEPGAVRRGERRSPVALWIGLGCLVAAGLVAAALLLRPEAPGTVEAPVPATTAAPADPALAAILGVRVRLPDGLAAARREAIVAALTGGGIAAVEVEALPFAVQTSRVGYYSAADREAAEALARLAAPLVTPGAALPVRDYALLADDAEPGRLDLWVHE